MATPEALTAAILVVLLAGCLTPNPPASAHTAPAVNVATWNAPVTALASCPNVYRDCFEPSAAVDSTGRLFVSNVFAELARSVDGGRTFNSIPTPALPSGLPSGTLQNDALLQVDPTGRLYLTTILTQQTNAGAAGAFTLLGVQVAASTDGGTSWPTNTYLDARQEHFTLGADRQWLAFDPHGKVYVSFSHGLEPVLPQGPIGVPLQPVQANTIEVASSTDGGTTFTPFVSTYAFDAARVASIGGPPLVDAAGTLHVPIIDYYKSTSNLEDAQSTDGGQSFHLVRIAESPDSAGIGDYFPVLASQGDRVYAAWRGGHNELRLAASSDRGKSWDPSTTLTTPDEPLSTGPWMQATGNQTLQVLYHVGQDGDKTGSIHLLEGNLASPSLLQRSTVVANYTRLGRGGNGDYAHLTSTPDGSLVVPWVQGRSSVMVSVRTPLHT